MLFRGCSISLKKIVCSTEATNSICVIYRESAPHKICTEQLQTLSEGTKNNHPRLANREGCTFHQNHAGALVTATTQQKIELP